ncbi:NAD(P)/FAD-dependent oxidoreductase [Rhodococcus sp. SORGH_AS_0301]|uniref:phytoene desaturase family protein n=1 Tax=Rhodococcus sp. SORGH_AS_0301 TaxID=3041780 RepID=UPI00278A1E54|nr:NAD(P)/FAD-dependent oxidoreductase [Rhodococcus sp. SORGH_AS_0301]MDQ1181810.1 all-trans-retinol 13,14-reductase [Rhodococcus sp. SORGH_AS_0301]
MEESTAGSHAWDAIVIGSGLGGMSAAAYLAAAGRSVLVLERYTTLGGSSHVFGRRGRWEFDCGVHYMSHCAPGGIVHDMMRGLGLDDRISWLPMDQSGFDRIVAPGFELATPVGWDAYLSSLLDTFPDERRAVRRFHGIMRRIGEAHDRNDMDTAGGVARWAARAGRAAPFMALPYAATLAACRLGPRTTLALSVQCGALGSSSSVLPTAAMAGFFQDYVGTGSFYPKGGGQILAAGYAEVITAHGGTIRTNSEVEEITVVDGAATGVRLTGGEQISASVVVSDADMIKTFTDLVGLDRLPRRFAKRVRGWRMSRPLINGFFGVEIDLSDRPNSNYFAIPNFDDATSLRSLVAFDRDVMSAKGAESGDRWARQVAARQPMFVQSSSQRDPSNHRAAPAGHATIEVQTITPASSRLWGVTGYGVESGEYRESAEYGEVKKIILDGMLERMEQAYPGSSSKVKLAELGSPQTQTRYVNNTAGAAFGLQTSLTQVGPMRPGDTTPIDGLYTVGTSTAWGPGTVGSMLSGVHAAGTIVGRDLVAEIRSGAVLSTSALPHWGEDFDPFSVTRALHDR